MQSGNDAPKRHWKRTWKVVLPSVVLGVTGYGLALPVLTPYLVQSFTACDTANDDCDGNRSQAQTVKTFSDVTKAILSLVFSPVLGKLSDRVGRKPVTIATVLACNVAPFLSIVLFKKTCIPYLIVSALSGIFSSSPLLTPTLFPYIADLYVDACDLHGHLRGAKLSRLLDDMHA